ncbi:hypothetical protein [Clostridium fessum]|uniref:hypothetical protein n=1 Tax=Clostridium fessum TaxID=2126740 RepID=UPI003AF06DF7
MNVLVLKNETKINLAAGASLSDLQVESDSREAMLETWKQLTDENLKAIRIETEEGLTIGNYKDAILVSETSVLEGEKVKTSFNLREKTSEEKRLDALEEGQAVQDAAIEDLGTATSELAQKEGVE